MNNYTSLGIFSITNSAVTGGIQNIPTQTAGRLIVIPIDGVKLQFYTTYGSDPRAYIRCFVDTSDAAWKQITLT